MPRKHEPPLNLPGPLHEGSSALKQLYLVKGQLGTGGHISSTSECFGCVFLKCSTAYDRLGKLTKILIDDTHEYLEYGNKDNLGGRGKSVESPK